MRKVRVRDLRWEAEGVLSVGLVDPDGAELPAWTPGAPVAIELQPGLERQYSLCGRVEDRREWRIGVLYEPAGRGGSKWIHERLRPGDLVGIREPRNDFELEDADGYLFIGGGIGITPILPMIAQADAMSKPWRLLYGGRKRTSMAFQERLAAYGDRVDIAPEDERGLLDLAAEVAALTPGSAVYCCGPGPLLDAIGAQCADLAAGTLHIERFTPLMELEEALEGDAFEVELARSGLTVHVADGQSIIDAVEAAGVTVDCSCLVGTCGTCETAVLEGEPDHRDGLLTDDEKAANDTMMICVSRSKSPVLKLDL
jgi:ferredoxin-NADP reductase